MYAMIWSMMPWRASRIPSRKLSIFTSNSSRGASASANGRTAIQDPSFGGRIAAVVWRTAAAHPMASVPVSKFRTKSPPNPVSEYTTGAILSPEPPPGLGVLESSCAGEVMNPGPRSIEDHPTMYPYSVVAPRGMALIVGATPFEGSAIACFGVFPSVVVTDPIPKDWPMVRSGRAVEASDHFHSSKSPETSRMVSIRLVEGDTMRNRSLANPMTFRLRVRRNATGSVLNVSAVIPMAGKIVCAASSSPVADAANPGLYTSSSETGRSDRVRMATSRATSSVSRKAAAEADGNNTSSGWEATPQSDAPTSGFVGGTGRNRPTFD